MTLFRPQINSIKSDFDAGKLNQNTYSETIIKSGSPVDESAIPAYKGTETFPPSPKF